VYWRGSELGICLLRYEDFAKSPSAEKYLYPDETSILTAFFRSGDFGFFKYLAQKPGATELPAEDVGIMHGFSLWMTTEFPKKFAADGYACLAEAQGESDCFETPLSPLLSDRLKKLNK